MARVLDRVLLTLHPHDITIGPIDDRRIADDADMALQN
jgi:hypothetical protein